MSAIPIPLWRQLQATARVVGEVQAGRSLADLLDPLEPALRPGVQALSFHVLRHLGRAQGLRQQLARRAPPAAVDALLCTALALAWRPEEAPYEPFTLVDQAVEAAKRTPATRAQAGFVNGCLRRFLREREALVARTDADPVARWNHPRWWIERLQREQPQRWEAILTASHVQAPMTLRVNARHTTVAQYLQTLAAAGMAAEALGPFGVRLSRPVPVSQLPGFDQGLVSVQDAAAQMASPLLLDGLHQSGSLSILDACAAPGGKTAHLLELSDARVTALDIDPGRTGRIHQNLQRLGLQARVVTADAATPQVWWDGEPFDAILLDAPCTASGIVRRHPDVPWLRRAGDVPRLAAIQATLLARLWPLLRPGGRLLYCTCSIFLDEGRRQVETFVAHNTDAFQRPAPGHLMPRFCAQDDAVPDNEPRDHDGFFYALLEKR